MKTSSFPPCARNYDKKQDGRSNSAGVYSEISYCFQFPHLTPAGPVLGISDDVYYEKLPLTISSEDKTKKVPSN